MNLETVCSAVHHGGQHHLVILARLEMCSLSLGVIRPGPFCISKLNPILYFLMVIFEAFLSSHFESFKRHIGITCKPVVGLDKAIIVSIYTALSGAFLSNHQSFLSKYTRRSKCPCNPNLRSEKCPLKQQEKAINSPTETPTTS